MLMGEKRGEKEGKRLKKGVEGTKKDLRGLKTKNRDEQSFTKNFLPVD